MKTILLTLLILIGFGSIAQPLTDNDLKNKGAFLRFEPSEVDMGKISMNSVSDETGNIEITIHNDGTKPLILQQVTACCGTNVKEWPRNPILPGANAKIKVYFRVEQRPYRISRTVTVNSNAVNGASQKVAILGEVVIPAAKNEIQLP